MLDRRLITILNFLRPDVGTGYPCINSGNNALIQKFFGDWRVVELLTIST